MSQALDDYVEEHKVVDETRRENAIRHLKAYFGARCVESIDIPSSRDYANARRAGLIGGGARRPDKTGSDSTIRRELTVLIAAANHAFKWKRIKIKPSIERPADGGRSEGDEAPYYTHDELERIFAAADALPDEHDLKWLVRLLYYTGARRASIEELRRGQVDWRARHIKLKPMGKRATSKRQPIVPILKAMDAPLRAVWDASNRDRLFRLADYHHPYRQLVESLGITDRAHPHCMRHTRATHLLQAGKSIYDVARLLGDTVATVERVYGHHSAAHMADALED
ncbi:integrase [Rhizobium azooxidifex]|uniref:Integrase n=1 Tax=Mycoplana azooxidifex TaxID=1636188 RepID=A0A7W6DJ90_9HYPH|nr:integrase [Mycoplana azooxidifex]